MRKPVGFWACPKNQRSFLDAIAPRIGITKAEEWENISHQTIREHKGKGLLQYYRSWSGVLAHLFPDVSFQFKRYETTFDTFYKKQHFKDKAMWRAVRLETVQKFAVENSLPIPDDTKSLRRWLKTTYPEEDWSALFPNPRKKRDFWINKKNVQLFLDQFASDHITVIEDWNAVTKNQISQYGGKGLFRYHNSVREALSYVYPEKDWSFLQTKCTYGFWSAPENQRSFLDKLAQRKGLQSPEDWKKISTSILRKEGGRSLLEHYSGLQEALETLYPEKNWEKRKYISVKPRGYWQDKTTQRKFFDEFKNKHDIHKQSDWSSITRKEVASQGGGQILSIYGSLFETLKHIYPELDWNPYEFTTLLPRGFWNEATNQRGFLDYLSSKYQLVHPADWKQVDVHLIKKEGGASLLNRYPSFLAALENIYPHCDWDPVVSRKVVPKHYWKQEDHVKRLIQKIAAKYQVQSPEEWYRVSLAQIKEVKGGIGLLHAYNFKMISILPIAYPDVVWDEQRLTESNKKASQRWLFLSLQQIYPKEQVFEEYLAPFRRISGMPIEIDVFIPGLSLGFEYQGKQHYEDLPPFGGLDLYRDNDEEKKRICHENGIRIIEVPYWWDNSQNTLLEFIKNETHLEPSVKG